MPITFPPIPGHQLLRDVGEAFVAATDRAMTGVVAAINEIRKTPYIEIALNDEERLVNIRFRVEGNSQQGPTNWANMNHVTGEFFHPATEEVVTQPRVQAIPAGNPTHLVVTDNHGNVVFAYRLGGKSSMGLVMIYDPSPPAEVMAIFESRRNGKETGSRATATGPTTGSRTMATNPPRPLKEAKLTLKVEAETIMEAARRSLANAGAREPVVMAARDSSLRVILYVVTDPNVGKFDLVQELTMQQRGGEAVTFPMQDTSHPYVSQITTPTGARHQLHRAPDQFRFTLHEVPLGDTYASQRRRWGMKEYPDPQRAADELQESVKTLREQVTVTSTIPPHPTHGQSMTVMIKTPSGTPGVSTYTRLTFYYYENWGWSFIDPSSLPPSARTPSEELLVERSKKFNRSPRTKKGTNFGESRFVPPYRAYPSHPGRGISFPYNLVVNTQTGAVFLINKGIDIAALTPETLGEYETCFFDRSSTPRETPPELETRSGSEKLSRRGPFASRRGSTSVDFLLSPVTLPFYVAEQVNWSAVKNLSLRGGVNLVNFGVPLLGGIGSEVALRGVEQLSGHQFSETTHHVGSLWGLAESGYLWGKYGAPLLKTAVLGAKAANPLTLQALSKTTRGQSYLHFIRGLPAFEAGAFGAKWIGQEFLGIQKGSLADTVVGFSGGLALGMGIELLLQLPQFKRLAPLMTIAGLVYLAVSSSSVLSHNNAQKSLDLV